MCTAVAVGKAELDLVTATPTHLVLVEVKTGLPGRSPLSARFTARSRARPPGQKGRLRLNSNDSVDPLTRMQTRARKGSFLLSGFPQTQLYIPK